MTAIYRDSTLLEPLRTQRFRTAQYQRHPQLQPAACQCAQRAGLCSYEWADAWNTVTFKGAGNAFNGSVKRMELWIDGKKIGQNLEDQLKIMTTVAVGKHTASLVAVDTFDNHISASVSFTVK